MASCSFCPPWNAPTRLSSMFLANRWHFLKISLTFRAILTQDVSFMHLLVKDKKYLKGRYSVGTAWHLRSLEESLPRSIRVDTSALALVPPRTICLFVSGEWRRIGAPGLGQRQPDPGRAPLERVPQADQEQPPDAHVERHGAPHHPLVPPLPQNDGWVDGPVLPLPWLLGASRLPTGSTLLSLRKSRRERGITPLSSD